MRDIILSNDYAKEIIKLINDPIDDIRKNAYNSMIGLTKLGGGSDDLIDLNMVEICVDKLKDEKVDSILILVHQLLKNLLYVERGTPELIKIYEKGIDNLCAFFDSPNSRLRQWSLDNLAMASFNQKCKEIILEKGCVLKIIKFLTDEVLDVRTTAILALSSLAQLNDGKHQVILKFILDN